ncbi:DUF5817 domain-containing protein [Haladaptatus cibarius]|uniref:DUF5817 domain-containing protein n=1 Tax=Haladaptatus cibarius TaxID=453847 RepID=UPI0011872DB6|nr:DUF5817 domain-containing protein [Haladaptatus cibarius]
MTYNVVGCSTCHGFWLVEDVREQQTAQCRLCGHQHDAKTLRIRFSHDEREVAAQVRARILAEKAGERERFENVENYAALETRIQQDIETQAEFLEQEAKEAFSEYYSAFGEEYEQYHDRMNAVFSDEAKEAFSEYYSAFEAEAAEVGQWWMGAFREELEEYLERSDDLDVDVPDLGIAGEMTFTQQPPINSVATIALNKPLSSISKAVLETDHVREMLADVLREIAEERDSLTIAAILDDAGIELEDSNLPGLVTQIAKGSSDAVETFIDRLRLTGHGRSSLEDTFVVGRLLALSDEEPTIDVRLSESFWNLDRSQREMVCEYLAELAAGCSVRLVGSGLRHQRLFADHRDKLPVSYDSNTQHPESVGKRVERAREELGQNSTQVRILRALRAESGQTLSYSALDSAASLSPSRRSQCLHGTSSEAGIIELGLAADFGTDQNKHVELLRAGEQYLDWLDDEIAQQRRLDDAFSEVCNPSDDSRVNTRTHEAPSPEDDTDRTRLPHHHSIGWLARWNAIGAVASAPENGVGIVDYPLQEKDDRGEPGWYYDADRDHLVVSAEYDGPMQFWVCIARALASTRTFNRVLPPERLDEDGQFAEFVENHRDFLWSSRCLGYLPNRVEDGADYIAELRDAENHLCDMTKRLNRGDFECSEAEFRGVITREALGLAGTMVHLLDLNDVGLTREVRLPKFAQNFDADCTHLHKTFAIGAV